MQESLWAEAAAQILRARGYAAPVKTGYPAASKTIPAAPLLWIGEGSARLTPLGLGQSERLRADVTLELRVYAPKARDCSPLFQEAARLLGGHRADCGAAVFEEGCFVLRGNAGLTLCLEESELPQPAPDIALDWKGELFI